MKRSRDHQINEVASAPDFPQMEKELLEHWYQDGVVNDYLHKNDTAEKKFFFQDGPITANNPMGVHHAWGRTYKDLWQRFKNMQGFKQRFQNGFDCQGLWVEVEVEKELGFKLKKDIEVYGVDKFVQECKDRVLRFSAIQTDQSKRLGYFMDWDNSYFTMSDENNYTIWHFLKKCYEKDWIYKGHESVPWCPRCETAISQHEMLTEDYKELTHKSIYLALPLVDRTNEFLLVWTTTPWTIPANIAVAVNADLDYSLVSGEENRKYWVATARVDEVFKDIEAKIIKTAKGKELVGLKYFGPFDQLPAVKIAADSVVDDKFHIVIATDELIMPISAEEGTGLVHTAVSAGTEDFALGKKIGLPMIPIIADNADYLADLDFLTGKNAKKHPEIILDFLTEQDKSGYRWVFKIENYTHRYPACWRCKTELVWKVADEWYVSMDKPDPQDKKRRTLRQKMVEVAKKITWRPAFGLERELDWLKNMHDWLISKKNRYWGLALPIWVCDSCGKFEVIGSKEELRHKAKAGWNIFEGKSPHKPYIDEVKIGCDCGGIKTRIPDVGNPWLDAGIVPFSTLVDPKTNKVSYTSDQEYWKEWFPADFITESFPGQFKNWFYSLIAMSSALEDREPFENVLGFASMLGEDGRAMHKSWGNSIEFNEGADKIGADVMRWTFVRHNPERNLLFGYKLTDEVRRQFVMLLWNSYRFFANYAALEKWQSGGELKDLTKLDEWIISRLNQTTNIVTNSLEKFDAFSASAAVEDFVSDLSTWYIRRSRDRIGPNSSDGNDKQVCYQTLYIVLETLSRLLAPFVPFVADSIYTNLTGEKSVHLSDWPRVKSEVDEKLLEEMALVRKISELGHAQRKSINLPVRQPLAKAAVTLPSGQKVPTELGAIINSELNIDKLEFAVGEKLDVKLDTNLSEELIARGKVREIVRSIQAARKDAGCRLDEFVDVILPQTWPKDWENEIKQGALVGELTLGAELKIVRK